MRRASLTNDLWHCRYCLSDCVGVQVCTAPQQYVDRVEFKAEETLRVSFDYVWRNIIQVLVGQEVVSRKL